MCCVLCDVWCCWLVCVVYWSLIVARCTCRVWRFAICVVRCAMRVVGWLVVVCCS